MIRLIVKKHLHVILLCIGLSLELIPPICCVTLHNKNFQESDDATSKILKQKCIYLGAAVLFVKS
ncbi:hypothetical protein SCA6_004029 [Theobroma cacao]